MRTAAIWLGAWCLVMGAAMAQPPAQREYKYPFQNPMLSTEERVGNILSLLTREEKIDLLGANYYLGRTPPSVNRLGITGYNQAEGLHGLSRGKSGSPNAQPTTTFIQSIGLGETWDPDLLQKAAGIEGYEARWLNQSEKYNAAGACR